MMMLIILFNSDENIQISRRGDHNLQPPDWPPDRDRFKYDSNDHFKCDDNYYVDHAF